MSFKVYLAAPYSWKEVVRRDAKQLRKIGVEITSSWLRERVKITSDLNDVSDTFLKHHALQDYEDILAADMIVLYTVDPTVAIKRGGRHVEFGIGYALKKRMVVYGPRENIFHYLPSVIQVTEFEDLITLLKELKNASN